jgi:hypothetical protein
MPCKHGQKLRRENLRADERDHQPLKSKFPFISVRLYMPAILFKGCQMRNFVDEGYQEAVFVQVGIYRYHMQPMRVTAVITVARYTLIDYLKIYPIQLYQFKNGVKRMFGQVWFKDMLHGQRT